MSTMLLMKMTFVSLPRQGTQFIASLSHSERATQQTRFVVDFGGTIRTIVAVVTVVEARVCLLRLIDRITRTADQCHSNKVCKPAAFDVCGMMIGRSYKANVTIAERNAEKLFGDGAGLT